MSKQVKHVMSKQVKHAMSKQVTQRVKPPPIQSKHAHVPEIHFHYEPKIHFQNFMFNLYLSEQLDSAAQGEEKVHAPPRSLVAQATAHPMPALHMHYVIILIQDRTLLIDRIWGSFDRDIGFF